MAGGCPMAIQGRTDQWAMKSETNTLGDRFTKGPRIRKCDVIGKFALDGVGISAGSNYYNNIIDSIEPTGARIGQIGKRRETDG